MQILKDAENEVKKNPEKLLKKIRFDIIKMNKLKIQTNLIFYTGTASK